MASIYNDKDVDWVDEYPDYTLRKKRKHNNTKISGPKSNRFHNDNFEGSYIDQYEDFDTGVSKESWAVCGHDHAFAKKQYYINKGGDEVNNNPYDEDWYLDIIEDFKLDDFDDEEF